MLETIIERLRKYAPPGSGTGNSLFVYPLGIFAFSLLETVVFVGLLLIPIHTLSGSEVPLSTLISLVVFPVWVYSLRPAVDKVRRLVDESPEDMIKFLHERYDEEREVAVRRIKVIERLHGRIRECQAQNQRDMSALEEERARRLHLEAALAARTAREEALEKTPEPTNSNSFPDFKVEI